MYMVRVWWHKWIQLDATPLTHSDVVETGKTYVCNRDVELQLHLLDAATWKRVLQSLHKWTQITIKQILETPSWRLAVFETPLDGTLARVASPIKILSHYVDIS